MKKKKRSKRNGDDRRRDRVGEAVDDVDVAVVGEGDGDRDADVTEVAGREGGVADGSGIVGEVEVCER